MDGPLRVILRGWFSLRNGPMAPPVLREGSNARSPWPHTTSVPVRDRSSVEPSNREELIKMPLKDAVYHEPLRDEVILSASLASGMDLGGRTFPVPQTLWVAAAPRRMTRGADEVRHFPRDPLSRPYRASPTSTHAVQTWAGAPRLREWRRAAVSAWSFRRLPPRLLSHLPAGRPRRTCDGSDPRGVQRLGGEQGRPCFLGSVMVLLRNKARCLAARD